MLQLWHGREVSFSLETEGEGLQLAAEPTCLFAFRVESLHMKAFCKQNPYSCKPFSRGKWQYKSVRLSASRGSRGDKLTLASLTECLLFAQILVFAS